MLSAASCSAGAVPGPRGSQTDGREGQGASAHILGGRRSSARRGCPLTASPGGGKRSSLLRLFLFCPHEHCMMITTTASADASIGSRNHCFCVARALTVCSRSKPRAHGPGLLATAPRCAPAPHMLTARPTLRTSPGDADLAALLTSLAAPSSQVLHIPGLPGSAPRECSFAAKRPTGSEVLRTRVGERPRARDRAGK